MSFLWFELIVLNIRIVAQLLKCPFVQLQEVQNQLARQIKEQGEMEKKLKKEREIQERAQQKYKNWLKKKNQEKMELEKKEKVGWTLKIFVLLLPTIYCIVPQQSCIYRRIQLDMFLLFLDRKKLPWRRSGIKSAAKEQKRNLKNGWQKQMKKAETLPKHPVLQQVGTFDIFRKFWKYEIN